jgi:hypothetical protein
VTRYKVLNPEVPTVEVRRKVDGAICVITASEFDPAVYTEVVPSVDEPPSPRRTKRQRDKEIMRGVYGNTNL